MVARGFAGRVGVAELTGTLLKSRGALSPSPLSLPRANSELMFVGVPPARLSQDSNIRGRNFTDSARRRCYISDEERRK
jgi:hypothetical protein